MKNVRQEEVYKIRQWVGGVARLTRLPVTEKIEGSNPFRPAMKRSSHLGASFHAWFEDRALDRRVEPK